MQELVRALKEDGRGGPTPEARERARAALDSKYEGVQSVAAQVLGAWGDRESVAMLRRWYQGMFEAGRRRMTLMGVGSRCLAQCIDATDAGWILDLYFSQSAQLQHEVLHLARALTVGSARERLMIEASGPDVHRRKAAVRLARDIQVGVEQPGFYEQVRQAALTAGGWDSR
jgi:hypothetical protein